MLRANLPPRLRLVHFSDVYELRNLPRLQTFLSQLDPRPDVVTLGGDFLSPSTLSALDGGKGMVQTLRAVGVTHAMLGNHEADLKLPRLQKRLNELIGKDNIIFINSNVLGSQYPPAAFLQSPPIVPYSIVETECKRVKIAMLGLMSDESVTFRDGTFRGAPIQNVCYTVQNYYNGLVLGKSISNPNEPKYNATDSSETVDLVLPLTHEGNKRDIELAHFMLDQGMGSTLILGGHDHEPIHEVVKKGEDSIHILKGRYDAQMVNLVDLEFQIQEESETNTATKVKLSRVETQLIELNNNELYPPSEIVSHIVDSHMAMLTSLEHEDVLDASTFLPPGVSLSSVGTRYQQTTVGGIFCLAMKEELEADVAVINGSAIKGNMEYPRSVMNYMQLKRELPFPTKMIVVPMKRWRLHEAIHYSRHHTDEDTPGEADGQSTARVERKGFLQVDAEFDRIGFHTGGQDDDLLVALPRNLLKGFCKIEPLMQFGRELKEKGVSLDDEDDFVPAIDLVVTHFSKEKWYEIVHDNLSFSDLDKDHKGFLTRKDVARMLRKATGHDPPEYVVDDMMKAVDADENGVIDQGEFSFLLAAMEREHGLMRFD